MEYELPFHFAIGDAMKILVSITNNRPETVSMYIFKSSSDPEFSFAMDENVDVDGHSNI
jgi:hypothetical protein